MKKERPHSLLLFNRLDASKHGKQKKDWNCEHLDKDWKLTDAKQKVCLLQDLAPEKSIAIFGGTFHSRKWFRNSLDLFSYRMYIRSSIRSVIDKITRENLVNREGIHLADHSPWDHFPQEAKTPTSRTFTVSFTDGSWSFSCSHGSCLADCHFLGHTFIQFKIKPFQQVPVPRNYTSTIIRTDGVEREVLFRVLGRYWAGILWDLVYLINFRHSGHCSDPKRQLV
jgi:hypothetical protein